MKIDVAQVFTACVKRSGGISLDEELESPQFENADYWVGAHNTAIELKSLTKNGMTDDVFRAWIESRYGQWVKNGWAPRPKCETFSFNLRDLHRNCYEDVIGKLVKKLESNIVRKANRQIRETRHFMGQNDAFGILAIANDGDHSLPPGMVKNAIARLLSSEKYPCINNVLHFTANELAEKDGDPNLYFFWADWFIPTRKSAPRELIDTLRENWISEHQKIIGLGETRVRPDSSAPLYDLKFVV